MKDDKYFSVALKIRALLAKAESTTEGEAASCVAKAQELLEIYNLDMLTIQQTTRSGSSRREDTKLSGGLYKWQRTLWKDVAETNFCMYWSIKGLTKGAKYEHRVLGSQINVLTVRQLAEYLQATVERLARERYDNDPKLYFSASANAYREGMADRLAIRLRDRAWERKRKKEDSKIVTGTELTLADVEDAEDDANNDFLNGWKPGTSARRRAERKVASAQWWKQYEEEQAKIKAEKEKFKLEHPEEWAKQEAERKAKEERDSKRYRARYRYRAEKPKDPAYYEGHDRGGSVSLDQQVDSTKKGLL